jgi:hypothetical protein
MVDGPSDTLYLTVSTLNLSTAIIELSNSGGKVLYPDAWLLLTTESERRRDAPASQGEGPGVAGDIVRSEALVIARDKFEELPTKVKSLLLAK